MATDSTERSQRNTLALRDVDYLITCSFTLTRKAGPDEVPTKFSEMFQRRLGVGQRFTAPYMGMREFEADIFSDAAHAKPIDPMVDRPLGQMFYDFEPVAEGRGRSLFFDARLTGGVLRVPLLAKVLADNGIKP